MLTLSLWLGVALGAPEQGIPVTIEVVDMDGNPIASAQIRHPDETTRHRVNVETGRWIGDVAYPEGGDELVFVRDMVLPFEITAPGHQTTVVEHKVHKKAKKNLVRVTLARLDIEVEVEADADGGPSIGFKHDKPRD